MKHPSLLTFWNKFLMRNCINYFLQVTMKVIILCIELIKRLRKVCNTWKCYLKKIEFCNLKIVKIISSKGLSKTLFSQSVLITLELSVWLVCQDIYPLSGNNTLPNCKICQLLCFILSKCFHLVNNGCIPHWMWLGLTHN